MQGVITRIVSNQYQVTSGDKVYDCIARGKVRLQGKPLVGDYVIFQKFENQYGIEEFLTRKNQLKRPAIVNVDQVLIVMSAVDPDFSPVLVDRLNYVINYEGLEACILVTKLDLVDEKHLVYKIIEDYRRVGIKVVDGFDLTGIEELLANKISVLTGQSGVGKSTCLNRLNPNFNLATQEISKALNRGKHTTRFTCLYKIKDGYVADTPGFSALSWKEFDLEKFSRCISDFKDIDKECHYRNCLHDSEPGCRVKKEVESGKVLKSRYLNYLDCLKLIKGEKQ